MKAIGFLRTDISDDVEGDARILNEFAARRGYELVRVDAQDASSQQPPVMRVLVAQARTGADALITPTLQHLTTAEAIAIRVVCDLIIVAPEQILKRSRGAAD